MNATERLEMWHQIINLGKTKNEIEEIYAVLVEEELKEAEEESDLYCLAKELCDVIIVCHPLLHINTYRDESDNAKETLSKLNINWEQALSHVNESNFSKLILENEIYEAQSHFLKKGIHVEIVSLIEPYFAAVSAFDQKVGGKKYIKGKVLKGPKYADIDTSIEWWM